MNKTKLLSLILGIIMLLPMGCATAPVEAPVKTEDANTSSVDVSESVNGLADRLGAAAEGNDVVCADGTTVTVAVGDTVGVDTNTLRNEGYIIRTEDKNTVIDAKTDDGIDAAVRKYAAEVEKDGNTAVNITSGLKIGKIT
ncbi:MAG: hypothetical protein IKU19_00785, partial [Clostridia bacterium]|nr:hypothetical protein [Clostridia bacterium]